MNYIEPYELLKNLEMTTIEDLMFEPTVPACCTNPDCYVEPDGYCEHGQPSILVELKMI